MNNQSIFALPGDEGACGLYRVIRPSAALALEVGSRVFRSTRLPNIEEWHRINPLALVTQRQTSSDQAEYWTAFRRRYPNTTLIMDFDDLLWNPHPLSTYRPTREMVRAMDETTNVSSTIVASTAPLKDALEKRYRREVRLLPNMLKREDFSPVQPRGDGERLKVVYAGSNTHRPDLDQLVPAVLQTLDSVDWVFFGYVPEPLRGRVQHVPAVPLADYLPTLRRIGAHVGVAPLVSHAFNECKSNVKILEYGVCGMATIASPVAPYLESKGLIVKSFRPREWVRAVEELSDETTRHAVALSCQEYSRQFLIDDRRSEVKRAFLGDKGETVD